MEIMQYINRVKKILRQLPSAVHIDCLKQLNAERSLPRGIPIELATIRYISPYDRFFGININFEAWLASPCNVRALNMVLTGHAVIVPVWEWKKP